MTKKETEQQVLTHSEAYVKKTNRIILIVGFTSLFLFIVGVVLLLTEDTSNYEYEEPNFTDNADALNIGQQSPLLNNNIEFQTIEEDEIPITLTPNPVPLGSVVLGTDAQNVLTLGTNGKASIVITAVFLAEPPVDGFSFEDKCTGRTLTGKDTCHISIKWVPVLAGNVQNNFIISWRETNLSAQSIKSEKVPVIGSAITQEECNYCETPITSSPATSSQGKKVRQAIGPDGKVIGWIDEDGIVRDETGKIIGRVNSNGLIVDDNGNVIGIADNQKIVVDENGNVIGYVGADGQVVDKNGNVIGKVLPDGTVVDKDGNLLGKVG